MERHCCRVCGRSFPTGRSLGGHMRSHVMPSSPMEDEEKPASRYVLRDNPKKSQRFDNAWPEKVKPSKLCPLLNSSSASGRSGDELNHEEGDDLWIRGSYQTYPEVTMIPMPVKKKRKRSSRMVAKNASEEEIGALCLWMLSRGIHSIPDSADKISPIIEFRNKVGSIPSEDKDRQFKKPKISSFCRNGDHCNAISSVVLKIGKRSLSNECGSESGMQNFYKRRRYVCTISGATAPHKLSDKGKEPAWGSPFNEANEVGPSNIDESSLYPDLSNSISTSPQCSLMSFSKDVRF